MLSGDRGTTVSTMILNKTPSTLCGIQKLKSKSKSAHPGRLENKRTDNVPFAEALRSQALVLAKHFAHVRHAYAT